MAMRMIRWGIIGCGNVTEKKSGPAFQKAENSALVAVMRRDAKKAADYARRHGVPKWYSSAQDLIKDPDVDAVYIATPPHKHLEYTVQVAAAGKPVYVEKPMARTYAECETMIRACNTANVPLFTAYYRRSLPRFNHIKELINAGQLGDIRSVSVIYYSPPLAEDYKKNDLPWRVIPEIAGGGRFIDLASHTLDLLDYYFGPIRNATGIADNQGGLYPAEDIVSAEFQFENGIVGNGLWCFSAAIAKDSVEITGSKGLLHFSTFAGNPVELFSGSEHRTWNMAHPEHIQQPHIQSIILALNGQNTCPSTGESGARTSRVMDWILADWRTKHQIDFGNKKTIE